MQISFSTIILALGLASTAAASHACFVNEHACSNFCQGCTNSGTGNLPYCCDY
ncbi:hypothetical protein CGMCC3_g16123 [Colletotrichum fructicola]|uniref:Uncharacterized protein n=1 Tax=Colletotrichum chrysophilum TaxID=1836956 RepID=A0AAD9AYU9_9PEZI|nr:uncharacterized protein CGMCC3_g16123 [Colletotrichum fructicola]KAE9567688.1 hypothetical protein CGMCC3_g16123 [Colletotrichum fructicola]KAK1856558.1 hypothetical protein CCHR01_00737 [Colletotrichum chrysophilum]